MHYQGRLFDQRFEPVTKKTRLKLGRLRARADINEKQINAYCRDKVLYNSAITVY